jgi:hypothetical protein
MYRGVLTAFFAVLGLWAFASCGSDENDNGGACSDEACLHEQLSEASPGDTVELKAGTFEGSFSLPAGVTLKGAGSGSTTLKFLGEGPVLEAPTAGGGTTKIQGLTIEAGAGGGISSEGSCSGGTDALELKDLSIASTGGVGLQVWEACSVKADNVDFTGNVDSENKNGIPVDPDKTRYAVVGMALVKVGQADLTQVTATGFAAYGVVLYETTTVWDGGEVQELVGTGIQADGGSADAGEVVVTLRNLTVHHVWKGATPYGFGVVASNGVHLVTENVTIENNDTAGLMMDNATGDHKDSKIRSNKNRGVWLQHCNLPRAGETQTVIIHGQNTDLDENHGVAVGIYKSKNVSISDGHINNTHKTIMPTESGGDTQIGDAIEIFESDQLTFTDLTLDNNERAGIVLDGGTLATTNVTFTNVQISGEGDRGFVHQNTTPTSSPEVVTEALRQADLDGGPLDVATNFGIENLPSPKDIIEIDH